MTTSPCGKSESIVKAGFPLPRVPVTAVGPVTEPESARRRPRGSSHSISVPCGYRRADI